jgi:acyl-CoA synthetase (AMP-forming)/AMP-acid ligase II
VFLGFLPAFHSFGMNVTGLLPLLAGLRVVRHPDPTDATNLVRKIAAYKVTVLIATPTFLHHILERAKPEELSSLKLIVTGAEKLPDAILQRCREIVPGASVAEGYGITECSPVVTCNPPGKERPGSIGTPLPGVTVRVVDLESGQPVGPGTMGMIQVSGPTVFPGYLSHEGESPFVESGGQRWYVTGDLGEFDADGYLWFRGRLKRFLKAGGEMISLPALEEPFAKRHPPNEDGPRVAVEGVEHEGKRRIVLFSTQPLNLRDANALLLQEGFHGVMRLDEVREVERIPVLGTGKIDYKLLRAEIQAGMK